MIRPSSSFMWKNTKNEHYHVALSYMPLVALSLSSYNHRIIERFIEDHVVLTPAVGRDTFHQIRLLKAWSNLALNTSSEGASTASLGNLCFTTLKVKNLFLISNLNLPSFSLKTLPLVLSLHALVKSPSPSFLEAPLMYWKAAIRSSQSLLQAEQPQLSQPFLTGEVFHPSDHCCGLLWTCSNRSMSVLCWGLCSWTQDSW